MSCVLHAQTMIFTIEAICFAFQYGTLSPLVFQRPNEPP